MRIRAVIFVGLAISAMVCFAQSGGKGPTQAEHRVNVIEFADFQCPFCARQASDLRKLQTEYPGTLKVTFKNFPLPFHKQSKSASLAALAAGEQGKFWEMHDLIFAHPGRLLQEDFDRYANELALDKEKFRHSMLDPALNSAVDRDVTEGKLLGVNATPTFVVNGHKLVGKQSYAKLKQVMEAELKGEPWPTPERVQVNVTGAPFRGPESAPVKLVEFADFQCPFCSRALVPLQRLLLANPGKVQLVFKNFPLDSHPDSLLAHMAALAAGEQGHFWEMHDLIFAHPYTMKRGDLLSFAAKLNLDMVKFQRDIENPHLQARIEDDKNEGEQLGVVATPTFLVNGDAFCGFSSEQLQAKIDAKDSSTAAQPVDVPASVFEPSLSFGPDDAPIKVQWYVDLTSSLTAKSAVALQQFVAAHPGKVQVEFKNFPLQNHSASMLVHEFALAAAAQGKFWLVEALLLADSKPKDREQLKNVATQSQLDQNRLWEEIAAHKYATLISHDLAQAKRLGISGTPTFMVGDKKLDGVNGLAALP